MATVRRHRRRLQHPQGASAPRRFVPSDRVDLPAVDLEPRGLRTTLRGPPRVDPPPSQAPEHDRAAGSDHRPERGPDLLAGGVSHHPGPRSWEVRPSGRPSGVRPALRGPVRQRGDGAADRRPGGESPPGDVDRMSSGPGTGENESLDSARRGSPREDDRLVGEPGAHQPVERHSHVCADLHLASQVLRDQQRGLTDHYRIGRHDHPLPLSEVPGWGNDPAVAGDAIGDQEVGGGRLLGQHHLP